MRYGSHLSHSDHPSGTYLLSKHLLKLSAAPSPHYRFEIDFNNSVLKTVRDWWEGRSRTTFPKPKKKIEVVEINILGQNAAVNNL